MTQDEVLAENRLFKSDVLTDKNHRYELLSARYMDQVVDVFTRAFCQNEPMTHYLKMDEKKYQKFALSVVEKAHQDQLSIIAINQDDKVVACALMEDMMDQGEIPDFDPKFVYILSLLESLGKSFFDAHPINKRQVAHLFITAVDPMFQHQGYSKQVNLRAIKLVAEKGFDYMYGEFTHYYNEKGTIFHLKTPKRKIGQCIYKEFSYQGAKPFENLEGGANSYLCAIRQDTSLLTS